MTILSKIGSWPILTALFLYPGLGPAVAIIELRDPPYNYHRRCLAIDLYALEGRI